MDYSKCEYLPNKNSDSNENMLFLKKTDGLEIPLSKSTHSPLLSTNPPISEQFFCPNFKNEIFGGWIKL